MSQFDMNPQAAGKYPELLIDLRDKAIEKLEEAGFEATQAKSAAFVVVELIRKDWAGKQHYIPQGLLYDLTERDWKVWEAFNGKNVKELVDRFKLSEQRIYAIIKTIRPLAQKRHQPDLF